MTKIITRSIPLDYFRYMNILTAEQIRQLDRYTTEHEPIASVDLMERAANKFFTAFARQVKLNCVIQIFCGQGNNGGDGLAIARMLIEAGYLHVQVNVVQHTPNPTADFLLNQSRLENLSGIHRIETEHQIPTIDVSATVIDAIFGTGLLRPVEGLAASVICAINASGAKVFSVDIPSGLFCDHPNEAADVIVESTMTYTFHAPKMSFMYSANGRYVPQFRVLDIGLHTGYAEYLNGKYHYITSSMISTFHRVRTKFSHKGTYGHVLVAAGGSGKMGAAVLAVKAAVRSGAGLVSALVPDEGYSIMQTTNPEAMVETTEDFVRDNFTSLAAYTSIAAGPGIGTSTNTHAWLQSLLKNCQQPLLLDADALNIISSDRKLLKQLPVDTILTPHPGEFKRLAGEWSTDEEKLNLQLQFSKEHRLIVVLKGAHTSISTSDGHLYFNSTGNAGMAKGGSGDVLTGVIASLRAQHYSVLQAALLGVYIHGLAGDLAAEHLGQTGMNSGDIIRYLPQAFKQVEK